MDWDQLVALSEHWSSGISGRADNKVASFSHGGERLGEILLGGTRPPAGPDAARAQLSRRPATAPLETRRRRNPLSSAARAARPCRGRSYVICRALRCIHSGQIWGSYVKWSREYGLRKRTHIFSTECDSSTPFFNPNRHP